MLLTVNAGAGIIAPGDRTLVVVHADKGCFEYAAQHGIATDEFVQRLKQQIEQSRRVNQPILPAVLRHYTNDAEAAEWILRNGKIPSHLILPASLDPRIIEALHGYDLCPEHAVQTMSDASPEVENVCEQEGYPTCGFDLVGMFTERCVFATAKGLRRRYPASTIRVLGNACLWFDASVARNRYERADADGIELIENTHPGATR